MKLVKIKINNRVDRILNFDCEGTPIKNNTYIIREGDNTQDRELFRINKTLKLIKGDKKAKDTTIIIKDIKENWNVLDVFFEEQTIIKTDTSNCGHLWNRKNKNAKEDDVPQVPKGMVSIKEYYSYSKPKPVGTDYYELNFHFGESIVSIYLYFAKSNETFDAIIDFGSEASQASWKNGGTQKSINLTENIKQQHDSPTKAMPNEQFRQFEDDKLYKSIYYIKKELKQSDIVAWPNYTKDNLKYLVEKNVEEKDLNDYLQLPNAKLIRFDLSDYTKLMVKLDNDDIVVSDIGTDLVERVLMNNIVLQVLRAIRGHARQKKAKAYIVLNILMPNVYPIHITTQKLNQLAEDINTFLETHKGSHVGEDVQGSDSQEEDDYSCIKAVELRAISESDASFLGYFNNTNDKLMHGKYLIMDAGKGTLDFSIMEYLNDGCPFVNKSRAGIIGAGNAITYGLIIGLVNDYLYANIQGFSGLEPEKRHKLIQSFIYNRIIKRLDASDNTSNVPRIDVATLGKFLPSVENYKKVYNELYQQQAEPVIVKEEDEAVESIDKLGIEKFIQWVDLHTTKKTYLSQESKEFVTIEIKIIVEAVIRKLNDMTRFSKADDDILIPVQGVIFTGRGFLMQELQDKMRERLTSEGIMDNNSIIRIPSIDILDDAGENTDKSMKNICMNIFQQLIVDRYDASPSRQTISVYNPQPEDKKNANKTPESIQEVIESDPDWDGGDSDSYNDDDIFEEMEDMSDKYSDKVDEGIAIPIIKNNSSLIIGGWRYEIKPEFQNVHDGKLYFDGIQYWLTASGHDSQKIADAQSNPAHSSLGYESLFPNIILTDESRVKIPRIKTRANAETHRGAENNPIESGNKSDFVNTNESENASNKETASIDDKSDTDEQNHSEEKFGLEAIGELFSNLFNRNKNK